MIIDMLARVYCGLSLLWGVACWPAARADSRPPLVYCAPPNLINTPSPEPQNVGAITVNAPANGPHGDLRRVDTGDSLYRVSETERSKDDDSPRLAWPLNTTAINSLFGQRTDPLNGKQRFHGGVDLNGQYGQLVFSAADGLVTMADWRGGHGRAIIIEHAGGYQTRYSHLAEHVVRKGMRVVRGQAIAYLGNSGRSTGPHLHFEVWRQGTIQDPLNYLSPAEGLLIQR